LKVALNMTKNERQIIENEVNRLIERMDRREVRQAKAEEEGDIAKVRLCERNDLRDMAKLDGIDFVLGYLGFRRKWDAENNRCVIYKID